MSPLSPATSREFIAQWDEASHVEALINELLVESKNDQQTKFKPAAWKTIAARFNEKTKKNYRVDQLKNKYQSMRKEFKQFEMMRNSPGFGWDPDLKRPTAAENVWKSYMESHMEAKCFDYTNKKSFKYSRPLFYEKLYKLFEGKYPTGPHARSALSTLNTESEMGEDETSALLVSKTTTPSTGLEENYERVPGSIENKEKRSVDSILVEYLRDRDSSKRARREKLSRIDEAMLILKDMMKRRVFSADEYTEACEFIMKLPIQASFIVASEGEDEIISGWFERTRRQQNLRQSE
ncbi:hypothetical protein K3495_g1694 [Podosphaera aphanis]|nr:hypothetical protein K3495_g1694 [Podosphaera aphanis]